MPGPPPKPSFLRARTNKKSTCAQLVVGDAERDIPAIPNPDRRHWHRLTKLAWEHAWRSPMAAQWLEADCDGLGRLALLWDDFYRQPKAQILAEIRLQEQRFGLSPLDRSRLQWEVSRAEEVEQKRRPTTPRRTGTNDPRQALMAVVK